LPMLFAAWAPRRVRRGGAMMTSAERLTLLRSFPWEQLATVMTCMTLPCSN
jgi:hypothetical protein